VVDLCRLAETRVRPNLKVRKRDLIYFHEINASRGVGDLGLRLSRLAIRVLRKSTAIKAEGRGAVWCVPISPHTLIGPSVCGTGDQRTSALVVTGCDHVFKQVS